VRIDATHRKSCLPQRLEYSAFIAAARLKTDGTDLVVRQPLDQRRITGFGVVDGEQLPCFQNGHVQSILGHIDADMKRNLCHPLIPSLLVRGRTLATVRAMEDATELLAQPRTHTKGCTGFRRSG